MPTYEFRCPSGHTFEKFYRKISDAQSEVPCPECGRPAERQLSGGAGLLFKGSGFYITDYGKDGKGPKKPDPPKSGGSAGGGGASGTGSSSGGTGSTGGASSGGSSTGTGGTT